jgi:hypothetical protein
MKKLFKALAVACALLGLTSAPASAAMVAQWTFETSLPATSGAFVPEVGAGLATAFHVNPATVYSSPAGNGSAHSFSSNTWTVGDYLQFRVSTAGFSGVSVSWDQTSSNTGPRDFQLQFSFDGSVFMPISSQYSVLPNAAPNPPWNATSASPLFGFSRDLSGIPELDNSPFAYFRLVNSSTVAANGSLVAAGGTSRVDNFTVYATPTAVPLPAAAWLLGSGVLALGGMVRRRRSA